MLFAGASSGMPPLAKICSVWSRRRSCCAHKQILTVAQACTISRLWRRASVHKRAQACPAACSRSVVVFFHGVRSCGLAAALSALVASELRAQPALPLQPQFGRFCGVPDGNRELVRSLLVINAPRRAPIAACDVCSVVVSRQR